MYCSVENYRKVFHIFARFFTISHSITLSKSGATGALNSKFASPSILLQIKKNYILCMQLSGFQWRYVSQITHFMTSSELVLKLTDRTRRVHWHAVGPIAYGLSYCIG